MKSDDRLLRQAKIACLCIMGASAMGMILLGNRPIAQSDCTATSQAVIEQQTTETSTTEVQQPADVAPQQQTQWNFTLQATSPPQTEITVNSSDSPDTPTEVTVQTEQPQTNDTDSGAQKPAEVTVHVNHSSDDDSCSCSR
jgi:hypothetical protein